MKETRSQPARYAPTPESLNTHPVPDWYQDAKLGIFIHWTIAAVPGFAPRERDIRELLRERYDDLLPLSPYTEWYENAIRFPFSPSAAYHRDHYGERPYSSFKADWEAALAGWQPRRWAERFARTGAGYVVLVTKHHDGYCLWPSAVPHPYRDGWRCPRDVVGELADAVRAEGMRFGVYYSGGIDWSFNPKPVRNMVEFIASVPRGPYPAYAEAQMRELIDRYAPDVLWNDIAWPTPPGPLYRLFADYYQRVPEGVVNDRWLAEGWLLKALRLPPITALASRLLKREVEKGESSSTPPPVPHSDFRTPEYESFASIQAQKWESVRGMDKSFGFNRASLPEDFLSREELIQGFVDIVSKNGNLLLNVGPRGEDAGIPDEQLARLDWLGEWLAVNGEAVRGTRPHERAEGVTAEGHRVRFTRRGEALYAIVLGAGSTAGAAGAATLTIRGPLPGIGGEVSLLGHGVVGASVIGEDLRIELDQPLGQDEAHAFRIA